MRFLRNSLVIVLFVTTALFAQEQIQHSDPTFIIEEISYNITGITREHSIRTTLGLRTGERFSSIQELEWYVQRKKQLLQNQRVFESSDITYTLGVSQGTGSQGTDEPMVVPVRLLVTTVDSLNLIGLLAPKYSSANGLELKLKLQHFNFFGSMQPLDTDIVFKYDEYGSNIIGGNLAFAIPFNAWGANASWIFNTGIEWPIGENPYISFNTGLLFSIPFNSMSIDIGITQGLTAFQRDDENRLYLGDELYFTEKASLSMPFVITTIHGMGDIKWVPSASFTYNWDADGITNDDLKSPVFSFGHGISGGEVNWNENFRSGFSASFTNNFSLNYGKDGTLHPSLEGVFQFFLSNSHLGFNSRLQWFALLSTDTLNIRDTLRGIKQNTEVESAFMINLDLPIKLFRTNWRAFGAWLTRKEARPGISIIDFELQVSPFADIAFIHDKQTDRWYHPADALYSAGLELLVFPLRWRSVQARFSLGQNLKELVKSPENLLHIGTYDVYIGVGLHY
ncbi:MAG: hypothetical protein LBU99_00480 [Spirochaetaceae bacterium]|jgi:hypothetical protein|nr:hypothetical protein [Spirochaetaceae bacterium]